MGTTNSSLGKLSTHTRAATIWVGREGSDNQKLTELLIEEYANLQYEIDDILFGGGTGNEDLSEQEMRSLCISDKMEAIERILAMYGVYQPERPGFPEP